MKALAKSLRQRSTIALALTIFTICSAFLMTDFDRVNAKKDNPAAGRSMPAKTTSIPVPQVSSDPSVSGKWVIQSNGTSVDTSWPIVPIHINLLPNGKFLFWGRDKAADGSGFDIEGFTSARVWDPFYKSFAEVNNNRTNLFCSGHSYLPDGRLLVAGGHEVLEANREVEGLGSKHTNIFDFRNNSWTAGPDMVNGRWYPFNVTLGTGETLILSGSFLFSEEPLSVRQNLVPQVFTAQQSLRDLIPKPNSVNRAQIENYPHLHLLPNSNVLMAVAEFNPRSVFLSATGNGSWALGPNLKSIHDTGTSVTYADGRVLIAGGRFGNEANDKVGLFDVNTNLWQLTTSMKYPRMHVTSTLLPDGKVLVTGGTTCPGTNEVNCSPGAVKNPELWNPADASWTEMAAHQEVRVYHSTAILMPDGRVLVGGGGLPGATGEAWSDEAGRRNFAHRNVEIFEPPYLFLTGGAPAPRPTIVTAPKEVTYGQAFNVGIGNVSANEVEAAVLVRLGAVTHGFNQDQRRIPLATTPSADGFSLNVTAPANPNQCPPGHYLLFVLKRNGANLTPSIAKIIRINKISPSSNLQVFTSSAESRSINVTAVPGTPWTTSVTAGSEFITVSAPGGEVNGSGAVNFSVAPNLTGAPRSGKITINVSNQSVFNQEIVIYQGKHFTDVPQGDLGEPASKINAMKISFGCGAANFCPDRLITRGEIAVFFVTAAIGPDVAVPSPSSVTFADVPPGHQFYRFIEDFAKRGFTAGCGGGNFCPTRNVTRGELAAFLVKSLGLTARATNNQTFTDVPVGHLFHKVVEEVTARGLMTGCGGGQFCPGTEVSRYEVAQALVKAYGF